MSKSLDPLRWEKRVSRKVGIHRVTDQVISATVVSLSLSRRSVHSGSRNSDTSTAMNLLHSCRPLLTGIIPSSQAWKALLLSAKLNQDRTPLFDSYRTRWFYDDSEETMLSKTSSRKPGVRGCKLNEGISEGSILNFGKHIDSLPTTQIYPYST